MLIEEMIDSDKVQKAVSIFCSNSYWKEFYTNAPSAACTEYIKAQFVYSIFQEPENIKEVDEDLESQFELMDWKYLYRYAGKNPSRVKYLKKIKELESQ